MRHFITTTLMLSALSACGGSGGGPTVITVPAAAGAFGESDVQVELTPSGETITVSKSGGPEAITTDTAPDVGTYRSAVDTDGDYTIAFVSASATSVAGMAVYQDGADQTHGVFYDRIGDTNLPTSGTATLNGDYVGMLIDDAGGGSVFGAGFLGEVTIDVDFGTQAVSGAITNREFVSLLTADTLIAGSSVADITLSEADLLDDGSFVGTLTGGAVTIDADTADTSGANSYAGLIAGTEATEAVGGISLPQNIDGSAYVEIGSFAAGH